MTFNMYQHRMTLMDIKNDNWWIYDRSMTLDDNNIRMTLDGYKHRKMFVCYKWLWMSPFLFVSLLKHIR